MTSTDLTKILVLRSSIVAPSYLEHLSRNPNNHITLGCRTFGAAKKLTAEFLTSALSHLTLPLSQTLIKHIADSNVVMSLTHSFCLPHSYYQISNSKR
ncbi:hypothetical protein BKA66DRAFT_588857 [Pyrenochaeta sp. MPI-SDFR-AT-0127]|nr:hypothetical protein BKA66DRAFT_588857 [Pyrenochaeta sp. MPI-SDFR-AT-0127]